MQILQVILDQNCETCASDGHGVIWDAFKDFVLPICLGFAAWFVARRIFIKETRRDKRKERKQKIRERNDKLFYFSALIENVILAAEQQKDNIKEHIRDIREDNVKFHLMKWITLKDFHRLSEMLNLEVYLLAYTNRFRKDRKSSVKEFNVIIGSVDYLYETFKMIPNQLKASQEFDYQRKIKLQNINSNIFYLSQQIALMLYAPYPQEYTKLTSIRQSFIDLLEAQNDDDIKYDLEFHIENFFVPLDNFCREYIESGKQIFPEIINLGNLVNEGIELLEYIQKENKRLMNDLFEDFKKICKSISQVRRFSKRLHSKYGQNNQNAL